MEARPIAEAIAAVLIEGFDKHYRLFRKTTGRRSVASSGRRGPRHSARCRSESASTTSASARTSSGCAPSSISTLSMLPPGGRSSSAISGLVDHHQPELAETFFNSVITRILRRTYSDNDLIFVRATISTDQIESDLPIYRSYYPGESGLRECFRRSLATSAGPSLRPPRARPRPPARGRRRALGPPGAEPPDPGARLGLLPEQGRLRAREDRERAPGAAVRRPRPPRRGRASGARRDRARGRADQHPLSRSRAPTSWSTWRCRPATSTSSGR